VRSEMEYRDNARRPALLPTNPFLAWLATLDEQTFSLPTRLGATNQLGQVARMRSISVWFGR
jgi:hypothetical protein